MGFPTGVSTAPDFTSGSGTPDPAAAAVRNPLCLYCIRHRTTTGWITGSLADVGTARRSCQGHRMCRAGGELRSWVGLPHPDFHVAGQRPRRDRDESLPCRSMIRWTAKPCSMPVWTLTIRRSGPSSGRCRCCRPGTACVPATAGSIRTTHNCTDERALSGCGPPRRGRLSLTADRSEFGVQRGDVVVQRCSQFSGIAAVTGDHTAVESSDTFAEFTDRAMDQRLVHGDHATMVVA